MVATATIAATSPVLTPDAVDWFIPSSPRCRCPAACPKMLPLPYAGRGRVATRIHARRRTQPFAQQFAGLGQVGFAPARRRGAGAERGAGLVPVADRPGHPADPARLCPVPPAPALLVVDRPVTGRLDGAELGDQQGLAGCERGVALVAQLLPVSAG